MHLFVVTVSAAPSRCNSAHGCPSGVVAEAKGKCLAYRCRCQLVCLRSCLNRNTRDSHGPMLKKQRVTFAGMHGNADCPRVKCRPGLPYTGPVLLAQDAS